MPIPPEREREEGPLSEDEAREAFDRLQRITSGLLRVPKAELEARLAEKRIKSRRRTQSASD
jgi:hypothetical protein